MTVHSKLKAYKCELCSTSFAEKGGLTKHLKRVHDSSRDHKCNLCEKQVFSSGELVVHMRVHTGEKPYKYQICATTFSQLCNLNRQIASHEEV